MKNLLLFAAMMFAFAFTSSANPNVIEAGKCEVVEIKEEYRTYAQRKMEETISPEEWAKLTPEEKKAFWLGKLGTVMNDPNINSTQLALVSNLIGEIKNMGKGVFEMNSKVQDIGLALASQFSEADFKGVFSSLEAYSLSGRNTPVCQICINDLQGRITYNPTTTAGLPTCNCRWTCGDSFASYSCRVRDNPNCCTMTIDGCGFMFFGPCDGYDRL